MNHTDPRATPTDLAMDHLLAAHFNAPAEQLAPSSGFALSVMDAVRAETAAPPPLVFPWRRVLPGAFLTLSGLIAFVVFVWRTLAAEGFAGVATAPHTMPALAAPGLTTAEQTLCWVALTACLSMVTVAASLRFTGRSR